MSPAAEHSPRAPPRLISGTPRLCVVLCVSARPSPTEAKSEWVGGKRPIVIKSDLGSLIPSRQERRKAERDVAKRAPAKTGAAGAGAAGTGGAAAARANVNMNPVGDWTTQAEDPYVLLNAIGAHVVRQRARAGDMEARWSLGYWLVSEADGGARDMGAGGRSPQADVGFRLHCTVSRSLTKLRRGNRLEDRMKYVCGCQP